MAGSRHRHSLQKSWAQRTLHLILPSVGVLALVVAAWAATTHGAGPAAVTTSTAHASAFAAATSEQPNVSRSLEVRPPVPEEAERDVVGRRYASAALDVHAGADRASPVLTEIGPGDAVDVTGKTDGGWAQIVHKGAVRWVTAKFLATDTLSSDKPAVDTPRRGAPCASGSAVESGLKPDTIRVHRAVCAKFPQISRYLGVSAGGEHGLGRAVDIMTANRATGDAIAAYLQAHARELGVSQLIWQQRIWTVQRAATGWRGMADRGSATANHRDHVHVTTYGDSGTS